MPRRRLSPLFRFSAKRAALFKNRRRQRGAASYRMGHIAEFFAALLLRLKFYRILASRYQSPFGEIDIIAMRGKTLVIIEVKKRRLLSGAAGAVSPHQLVRLRRAAAAFVAQNPVFQKYTVRFDAVLLAPFALPRHIKNAWSGE